MSDLPPWAVHVNDLSHTDPDRRWGVVIGDTITHFVGHLANDFPNEPVNRLMGHVWNLFGSRRVNVAMYKVSSLSFGVFGTLQSPIPVMLIPQSWLQLGITDPLMAVAGLVYCGSQAVDFYNGLLLTDRETCMKRALAYESEFLLSTLKRWPETVLNDYQREVLDQYPQGFPSDLVYEMKPSPHAES